MRRDLSGWSALLVVLSTPGKGDLERFVNVVDGQLDLDQILAFAIDGWDLPPRRLDVVVHADGTSGDITVGGHAIGKWRVHENAAGSSTTPT